MSSRMTQEECQRAIEGLSPQLDRYAELIVRKGAAVREGQEVVLQAPVERADTRPVRATSRSSGTTTS